MDITLTVFFLHVLGYVEKSSKEGKLFFSIKKNLMFRR
jgi:hypothetical protein